MMNPSWLSFMPSPATVISIPIWQAVILAVVQGITEFLPVSSTAHLILFPWLLGWRDPGLTFDVALHAGTLIAVVAVFFETWLRILRVTAGAEVNIHTGKPIAGAALHQQKKLLWLLMLATVPGGIFGWIFERKIETSWRSPWIIAFTLVVLGILLHWADRHSAEDKDYTEVSTGDAWWIGCAQALALVPGVSRSGSTITAGRFFRLDRESAARFSFLMATPITAGAVLKKSLEVHHQGLPHGMIAPMLAGIAVSALVGIVCIRLFLKFLRVGSYKWFAIYRVLLGLLVAGLLLAGFHG